MSRNDRRFARFYYEDFLREYPEVWADAEAFSAWFHLLVEAEQKWPLSPELPRSLKARPLRTLVEAGLIALGPRHTFAVRGHDAERARRHSAAIVGANASANARATAQAIAEPSRARDENEQSSPLPRRAGKRSDGTNPRAQGTNPRANGTSPRQVREDQKRGAVPVRVHDVLAAIATKGKS